MPQPRAISKNSTPADLGYRMPAEWEPHEATWLGWPHEVTDWPGKFATIPWAFAEIVRLLSEVERVFLLVENRAAEVRVRSILKKAGANLGAVDFFGCPPIAAGCAIPGRSAFEILMATWLTITFHLTGGRSIRIIRRMRW